MNILRLNDKYKLNDYIGTPVYIPFHRVKSYLTTGVDQELANCVHADISVYVLVRTVNTHTAGLRIC